MKFENNACQGSVAGRSGRRSIEKAKVRDVEILEDEFGDGGCGERGGSKE